MSDFRVADWLARELGSAGRGAVLRNLVHEDETVRGEYEVPGQPGMVVVISDLLVDEAEMTSAVSVLRAVGHDVTVLHIIDPVERDLGIAKSEAELIDTESLQSDNVMISEMREAYRETVNVAIDEWRGRFAGSGASYEVIQTDQPFGVGLRRAFAARQHLP